MVHDYTTTNFAHRLHEAVFSDGWICVNDLCIHTYEDTDLKL